MHLSRSHCPPLIHHPLNFDNRVYTSGTGVLAKKAAKTPWRTRWNPSPILHGSPIFAVGGTSGQPTASKLAFCDHCALFKAILDNFLSIVACVPLDTTAWSTRSSNSLMFSRKVKAAILATIMLTSLSGAGLSARLRLPFNFSPLPITYIKILPTTIHFNYHISP